MFSILKTCPAARWLKWVYRTYRLKKQYPTVSIGVYSEVAGKSSLGHRNVIYEDSILINTKLDDYTYIGSHVKIQNATIGKFCSIAEGVKIGLGIHPTDLDSTHPAFYSPQSEWKDEIEPDLSHDVAEYKEIHIGDDVWIGTNAMILDGVTIGSHAIIAAGAIVTKDVHEYATVGGIPARVLKIRK